MRTSFIFRFLLTAILPITLYLAGPQPAPPELTDELPVIPAQPAQLENFVQEHEAGHKLKPGNEARIVWNDPENPKPTRYAIVYLHGFSASHYEGYPIHHQLAKRFGCNLYLARLADHGVDTTDALVFYTPDRLWESAKMAYQVGKKLGDEVILVSTSTGGTVALMLAARYPDIAALVNYSPNIRINDQFAFILNNPWGLQIASLFYNGYLNVNHGIQNNPQRAKYWYGSYRIEALASLQELVETSMNEATFKQVTQPVFNGYYYKNEEEQDHVVKVEAILAMHKALGTPEKQKTAVAFPNAGAHVIGCEAVSKDLDAVLQASINFLEANLQVDKIKRPQQKNPQQPETPFFYQQHEPEITLTLR